LAKNTSRGGRSAGTAQWLETTQHMTPSHTLCTEGLLALGYPKAKEITQSCCGVLAIRVPMQLPDAHAALGGAHQVQRCKSHDAFRETMYISLPFFV
jgi:hypothetical protein